MNKYFSKIIILSSSLLLISCNQVESLSRDVEEELESSSEVSLNSLSTSQEKEKTLDEYTEDDYPQIPSKFVSKMHSYNSYKAITKGNTHAVTLGFIETDQSIDVTLIKSEYSYLLNESHSDLVNTVHEAYFHNDLTYYHNDGGDYVTSSLNDYLDKYGINPFGNSIEGYKISDDAILSITKIESEENYKFKISFDPVKATNNVKIQMKAFGGLDKYPSFKNIDITLTLKEDFEPVKLELVSDYTATKFVDSECHQEYSIDYSSFDEENEVPNLDEVKSKI